MSSEFQEHAEQYKGRIRKEITHNTIIKTWNIQKNERILNNAKDTHYSNTGLLVETKINNNNKKKSEEPGLMFYNFKKTTDASSYFYTQKNYWS